MNESALRELYAKQGRCAEWIDLTVSSVAALAQWLFEQRSSPEQATVDLVRRYLRRLIDTGQNQPETLVALARYFEWIGRNDVYLYFTSLLGGEGVIESIRQRLSSLTDRETGDVLLGSFSLPPLGTDPAEIPAFTASLMERLEANLSEQTVRRALCGNHHAIPASAFEAEQRLYQEAPSLDVYLRERHERQVATLQKHCDAKTVWFEQIITQRVVDLVAKNPEMLSAVRRGNTLYVTKIPYDPDAYLATDDSRYRRYYACHCPFVREAILRGEPVVSANWCYCSGGFAKYPYEVILGRALRVTLLESVLKGDSVCRFAIHLCDCPQEP